MGTNIGGFGFANIGSFVYHNIILTFGKGSNRRDYYLCSCHSIDL